MADNAELYGLVTDRIWRRVEKRKTSSGSAFYRLIRSGSFQHRLRLTKRGWEVFRSLYEEVCPRPRLETEEGFSNLAANLVFYRKTSVILPMKCCHSMYHLPRRYGRVRPCIIDLVKKLNRKGWVHMKQGFHFEGQGASYTKVWATERFIRDLDVTGLVEFCPRELVELRDWKTGELVPYMDTPFTRKVRRTLSIVNKVNSASDIRLGRHRVKVRLVAIFLDDFRLYGRLHSFGSLHYQGLPKEDRAVLTIGGQPVVELDFCGLHPHLLYAAKGIQLEVDPYDVVLGDMQGEERLAVRPFLKVMLLCMLNSDSFRQAESASNYWLLITEDGSRLRKMGIRRARPIMERFLDAHSAIEDFFFRGKREGLMLMNKDAQIALSVVGGLSKKGVPVLPVHDSFIVSQKHRDLLESRMLSSYAEHTGGFRIPIH